MRKKRKPLADINIVPYIDVMLVLLVIFMITTPMLTQGVKVSLPEVGGKKIQANEGNLPYVVSLTSDGIYAISHGESSVTFKDLNDVLRRMSAHIQLAKNENQKAKVLVRADKAVSYEKVLALMSVLQKSGANNLGLLTAPIADDGDNHG